MELLTLVWPNLKLCVLHPGGNSIMQKTHISLRDPTRKKQGGQSVPTNSLIRQWLHTLQLRHTFTLSKGCVISWWPPVPSTVNNTFHLSVKVRAQAFGLHHPPPLPHRAHWEISCTKKKKCVKLPGPAGSPLQRYQSKDTCSSRNPTWKFAPKRSPVISQKCVCDAMRYYAASGMMLPSLYPLWYYGIPLFVSH